MKQILLLLTLSTGLAFSAKSESRCSQDLRSDITAWVNAFNAMNAYMDSGDTTSAGAIAAFNNFISANNALDQYADVQIEEEWNRMPGPIILPCVGCAMQFRACVKNWAPGFGGGMAHYNECLKHYNACAAGCQGTTMSKQ